MSKIVWDKTGEHRYEAGLDRGVLYLPDGSGVPWNGLTAVEEDFGDISSTAFYFDGIKYMDTRYPGDFSASLKALTYPDEFLQFDGYAELDNKVLLGHQPVYDRFGLAYRTMIGNDVDGIDHGYKIHILYNLVAIPDNRSYPTLSDSISPTELGWKITGVPEELEGYRPTVHIILDTTRINRFLISDVERILYGQDYAEVSDPDVIDGGHPAANYNSDVLDGNTNSVYMDGGTTTTGFSGDLDGGSVTTSDIPIPFVDWDILFGGTPAVPGLLYVRGGTPDSPFTHHVLSDDIQPNLPPLSKLVEILDSWVLIDIVDNGDGTWTATGPDELVSLHDLTSFEITSGSAHYLSEDTYEISTTHTF